MGSPSRRQILEGTVGAAVAATASFAAPAGAPAALPLEAYLSKVRDLRDEVRRRVRGWVDAGRLARPDGFVYAVDVAQLMACFVEADHRSHYEKLRDHALYHLIVDDPSDAFTRGFVLWRHKPVATGGASAVRDASGTTEALRLAKALWHGASRFGLPGDREAALTVLRGYARHATEDQGVWMVRNYFGFGTRSFASNSFLVDYDADFVRAVADETGDAPLADLSSRSYAAVRGAVTAAGLLYDLIQPELKTMYPLLPGVVTFSPNDVVQLSNATTVAATVARGAPDVARRVLDFALSRGDGLRMYHYGRTGEPVNDSAPGINEWAGLTRLAVQLGDRRAAATFLGPAVAAWDYYYNRMDVPEADAYVASEALAAMAAVAAL